MDVIEKFSQDLLHKIDLVVCQRMEEMAEQIITELKGPELVKGVAAGIAKPLGVSVPTAYKLFNSGIFDDAVSRRDGGGGRQIILVDVNKVREIALRTNITVKINKEKTVW